MELLRALEGQSTTPSRTRVSALTDIEAMQNVAWVCIANTARAFAATSQSSCFATDRFDPSAAARGAVLVATANSAAALRPSTLWASEPSERPRELDRSAARRFSFLSSGIVVEKKRVRPCDNAGDVADEEPFAPPSTAQRSRRRVTFVTAFGTLVPAGPITRPSITGGCFDGAPTTTEGDSEPTGPLTTPPVIVLPKGECAATMSISYFRYDVIRKFKQFVTVSSTEAIGNGSGGSAAVGTTPVAAVAAVSSAQLNDAGNALASALLRCAGSIVNGHTLALSRVLDGNARIPRQLLTSKFTESELVSMFMGETEPHVAGSLMHPSENSGEWWCARSAAEAKALYCTPEELANVATTFLRTLDPVVLVAMIMTPMAPLRESEKEARRR